VPDALVGQTETVGRMVRPVDEENYTERKGEEGMNYDYETYFDEPSEFDEKCNELVQMLKDTATAELKAELERLRAENARMRDIVQNYDEKVRDLELKARQYKWDEDSMRLKIKHEVRMERLRDLLADFQYVLYAVMNEPIPYPKCNKCDGDRYIHFTSPSGKDCKELCDCSRKIPNYTVKESDCVTLRISTFGGSKGELLGYYRLRDDSDGLCDARLSNNSIYTGQPYETIDRYSVFFKTHEDAQKYADWLNDKAKEKKG
jgi:hypothetical protein